MTRMRTIIIMAIVFTLVAFSLGCTTKRAIKVTLDQTRISLLVGDNQRIGLQVSPTHTKKPASASWGSSNTQIAAVNQNGLVTAIGEGTCMITYTFDKKVSATEPQKLNQYES